MISFFVIWMRCNQLKRRLDAALQTVQFEMNCAVCLRPYKHTSTDNLPRVLLNCGHTFCHQCIESRLLDQTVICFTCAKPSSAPSVETFPINDSLINFISTTPRPQVLCKQHSKKIEIFCEKDNKLLCSQCMIQSHQHHKMMTVAQKAEKQRVTLNDSFSKIKEALQEYSSSRQRAQSEQVQIQHAFLDCQAQANLFYQTIQEEVIRLRNKEIDRLTNRKEEALKRLASHREDITEQINFLSELQLIFSELSQMSDAQFLTQDDKRSFVIDSSRGKRIKYTATPLQFRKGVCLQQISKSVAEMISLQNNRASISMINLSPSLKKQKEPAILQVNLKEEYMKRKGNLPSSKPKPAKKTISIHSQKDNDKERQKISESLHSRNSSHSVREHKIDLKLIRENSVKRAKGAESLDSSILSISDMSHNFTPMSSVHSFMESSRNSISPSQADSFFQDTTLKNTFLQFSAIALDDCVYHFGGLTNTDSQKYRPDTCNSERIAGHSQFKRRGFQAVCLKVKGIEKCLLIGGIGSGKNSTSDIYEFNFKDERLSKSLLKLSQPRSSFGCVAKDQQIFIVGGKTYDRPLNTFEKCRIEGKELQSSKMANMSIAREDLACCLGFDGAIYALGGITSSNDATNSAERFNWQRNNWETIKSMRFSRISFVAVPTPRGIFVIGGHTTKKYLREVQFYSFDEDRWIQKAPMAIPRCYHSALLSKDYQTITVFGGFHQNNELDSIQIFNIAQNVWSCGGKMKEKRCLHVSIQSNI